MRSRIPQQWRCGNSNWAYSPERMRAIWFHTTNQATQLHEVSCWALNSKMLTFEGSSKPAPDAEPQRTSSTLSSTALFTQKQRWATAEVVPKNGISELRKTDGTFKCTHSTEHLGLKIDYPGAPELTPHCAGIESKSTAGIGTLPQGSVQRKRERNDEWVSERERVRRSI